MGSRDFIAVDYNHASSAIDYLRVNRDVGADHHRPSSNRESRSSPVRAVHVGGHDVATSGTRSSRRASRISSASTTAR